MKKLLLAILLLSSVAFAQTEDLRSGPPECAENRMLYLDGTHMFIDLCTTGLSISNLNDCGRVLQAFKLDGTYDKIVTAFFTKRHKDVCGK